jgi:hypothetical protein
MRCENLHGLLPGRAPPQVGCCHHLRRREPGVEMDKVGKRRTEVEVRCAQLAGEKLTLAPFRPSMALHPGLPARAFAKLAAALK